MVRFDVPTSQWLLIILAVLPLGYWLLRMNYRPFASVRRQPAISPANFLQGTFHPVDLVARLSAGFPVPRSPRAPPVSPSPSCLLRPDRFDPGPILMENGDYLLTHFR